jgi:DNA-binding CsgD family transcriptional regulator/tetratricopeptide (TPR) repeat protein
MSSADTLKHGRVAFKEESWREAYDLLASAESQTSLDPEDLEMLAKSAYLVGKETQCTGIWARAHQAYVNIDNIPKAAYCAFWLGMIFFDQGENAQGGGWMARAKRLSDDYPQQCAEQGLLLIPQALQHMRNGEAEKAQDVFSHAVEIGQRFKNPDVAAIGRLGRGQALILQNKISEGTALLDEAMVAVISNEVSPIVAGLVYCAVIETFQKIYDLRRAQEWTTALSRWCDSHPELVPYRGQCLVRRAEVMQLHGEWVDAVAETERACEILSKPPGSTAAGQAFYRQGELNRLQGKFSKAMEMYRQASKWGLNPQPGLALLRLAQGKIDVAKSAIRQSENEKSDQIARSIILPAFVEIMLEAGEIPAAQSAADELAEIAAAFQAGYLQAIANHAQGSILLASGELREALEKLRSAWTAFNDMEASYESARARVLIGLTCRELGDDDTAEMEFETAREIFQLLGAEPDLKKVNAITSRKPKKQSHGLTDRELEVLQLLSTGKTNKQIAAQLFISERTVDRHVSNIFMKLDVPSRTAATVYAFEHNLV